MSHQTASILVEIEDYAGGEGITVDEAMERWPFEKWFLDVGVKVEGQENRGL